ncbi:MAG: hypothetical protein ACPLZF_04100 [Nitrososphaeria archaeon]
MKFLTDNIRVASIALLFKNSSGAKTAYNEIISFLSYRRTYDSFSYVWVHKWDNVEDIINHFIIALYNNHPYKVSGRKPHTFMAN